MSSEIERTIRAREPQDTDEIISVWLDSTIPGQAFLPETHWRGLEPMIRDTLMPMAETWVALDGDRIVAFISLLGDMIGGFFTNPSHQGKGRGRALLEHVKALHDPLTIEVFRANERSIAIYEHCGFVEESSHTDEMTGLEAVIMKLTR